MLNLISFPPSNFGRYGPPIDCSIDETEQEKQDLSTSNIPSALVSLSISAPVTTTTIQTKSTVPASVIKENIEPLSFPQHDLGPIQRPNKLHSLPTVQSSSSFLIDCIQSPSTPEILVQINDLLHHQNSITTMLSNPNAHTPTNASNFSWSPSNWSSESWPVTSIPTANVSLMTQVQDPFVQRQTSKDESLLWSIAPTVPSSNAHLKQDPEWNEFLSSSTSSSIQTTQSTNHSWLESNSSLIDNITSNQQENEGTNPLWNLINLDEIHENSSTLLWPKTSNDNDQSRWDFAR